MNRAKMAVTNMHAKPYMNARLDIWQWHFQKYINIFQGWGGVLMQHLWFAALHFTWDVIMHVNDFLYSDTLWKWKAVQRLFDPGKADVRWHNSCWIILKPSHRCQTQQMFTIRGIHNHILQVAVFTMPIRGIYTATLNQFETTLKLV